MPRPLPIVVVVALAWASGPRGLGDAPPAEESAAVATAPLADSDAADHVGEECVVEFVVRAARALADKDICFLNSRRDRRDEENFTVVIFKDGLARFRKEGIENPALHFLDRRIRVRGVISEHKDKPQIVVEEPGQIETVEEPAGDAADAG